MITFLAATGFCCTELPYDCFHYFSHSAREREKGDEYASMVALHEPATLLCRQEAWKIKYSGLCISRFISVTSRSSF